MSRAGAPDAGWLTDQMPRHLAEDDLARRMVEIFEEIAGGIRGRVNGFEHYLDVGVAPEQFVHWMGTWLDVSSDRSVPGERQRDVVRAAGLLFARRGTKPGLQGLLEAFTQGEVDVHDDGGVFREGAGHPATNLITVGIRTTTRVDPEQLFELIQREVPPGTIVQLQLRAPRIDDPPRPVSSP